jgi:hypothetical protein
LTRKEARLALMPVASMMIFWAFQVDRVRSIRVV